MPKRFDIQIISVNESRDIPDAWPIADLRAVLVALEMDDPDLSDADVPEYVSLALQELGVEDAPAALLGHLLTDDSSPGAQADTGRDFADDKPWDEYADMSQHYLLWRAGVLLHRAFPGKVSTPVLAVADLGVVGLDDEAVDLLRADPLPVELVARLLGGDGTTTVARLFPDELDGAPFVDAASIVWRHATSDHDLDDAEAPSLRLRVWSSVRWLADLEDLGSFKTSAWADDDEVDESEG